MPQILSGSVLRDGSSQAFLTLAGAQPALNPTPSTITGFTLVVSPTSFYEYRTVLGNINFIDGSLTNIIAYQDISINTPLGGTFQVNSPTFLNQNVQITTSTVSTGTASGALSIVGGLGVGGNINVGGLLNVGGNVAFTASGQTVNINPGVLGTLDNMNIGSLVQGSAQFTNLTSTGTVTFSNLTNSVSTASGAVVITGGVGVGQSLYANRLFDSNLRVVNQITAGPGISTSIYGPSVAVTNTGVLSLRAGTGTNISSTTGNITIWVDPQGSTTLQAVTARGNTTTDPVYFYNTGATYATTSGAIVISGGLGVGQDVRVGGTVFANNLVVTGDIASTVSATNIIVSSNAVSTSTLANNALYVAGGIGATALSLAGNAFIYGNLTVLGTQTIVTSSVGDVGRKIIALSTSAGPAILSIDSGITVGPVVAPFAKFLYDGVSAWKSTGDLIPSDNYVYTLGNSSYNWLTIYGGRIFATGGNGAANTSTGALVVQGGAGISGNIFLGGQLRVANNTASTSTTTGAAIISGGIAVAGSTNLAGTAKIYDVTSSTNTQTGAMVIMGGLGVGGAIYASKYYTADGNIITSNTGIGSAVAGTDTTVSTSSGVLYVWSTATLQSITSRSNTTDQQINLTNTTQAVSSTTGALIVSGGIGVSKGIQVGGSSVFYSDVTFYGTVTNILSTNTVYTDNILELHKPSTGAWTFNDNKDIGIKFTYYAGTSTSGFLGRANDTGYLEWYSTGTEQINGTFSGTYGTFKTGAISLVNPTASVSTTTGAMVIKGGLGVGGSVYVAGPMYSGGFQVLTSAALANYGVASITAGTGTAVSTATGPITIWSTNNFQTVTDANNSTTNALLITNATSSLSTQTGALQVYGGIATRDNLYVFGTANASNVVANSANVVSMTAGISTVLGHITVSSNENYPVQVFGNSNNTSSYYITNFNSGTSAYSAYTLENDANNFVEFGINSSNRSLNSYSTGSAYLYLSQNVPSFNIGNASPINFYTQDITTANQPILSLGSTGTVTVVNDLAIINNNLDPTPKATLSLASGAVSGYSSITLKNTSFAGQSYSIDVGGNNRAGSGGSAVNEGNFTIRDNTSSTYRFIIAKGTGNILIGQNTDDLANKLQVNGDAKVSGKVTVGIFSATTATFGSISLSGNLDVQSTATFNQTVVIGSSSLETNVTNINTTNQTSIDSFDATLYRSAKCLVQVEDGNVFHLVEVVLLHDNLGQVYISQYGIIATGGSLGDFSASMVNGRVVLYFTAYSASSKVVNVVRTTISV